MRVLKRSSVYYDGEGIDISNSISRPVPEVEDDIKSKLPPEHQHYLPIPEPDPEELLKIREKKLDEREEELEQKRLELIRLKDSYIEQGKDVILEAKRRAEGIVKNAEDSAAQIVAEAEASRDDIRIKARAEGFEQGRKDGVEACLAAGRDVLDEAKAYSQRILTEKEQLFESYEKDIYETIMAIANKVTLDSITSNDSKAIKRLIKKAAKEFRASDRIKITLNRNGATEELAGDYEYLKELCGGIENIEVELLEGAEPGTVIVDNGSEITDAGVQTQLRMIKELGKGKFRAGTKKKAEKKPPDNEQSE